MDLMKPGVHTNMKYKNYIFDLYATLIDIHTDQKPISFWRYITAILESYGAVYTPADLRTRYRGMIQDKESRLSAELGTEHPEIDIGDVFTELLLSAPEMHDHGIWGDPRLWGDEEMRRWLVSFSYSFRVISRIRFRLYPDTIELLDRLKQQGKHIFLLSNAQSLFTRPEMSALGLMPYFEKVFISSECHMKKPEMRFMTEMLEKCGLDICESVMIGNDMNSDILMAARCGVNAVLVNHDGYTESEIQDGFQRAREAAPDWRRESIELRVSDNLKNVF